MNATPKSVRSLSSQPKDNQPIRLPSTIDALAGETIKAIGNTKVLY